MNYPDMKDLLREQAKDDYIKYGCPTLGVQHGTEPVPRRAITIESTLLSPDLYECNECHCLTNAKQRICCDAGKLADTVADW